MSVFAEPLRTDAANLIDACRRRNILLASAESCTGGLFAGLITSIPGASDIFDRGFVTYSNAAKEDMLGISAAVLARFGAVSEEIARAMAEGALARSRAGLAVSVTGVAGPAGGSAEKPVGLVHIAAACRGRPMLHSRSLLGARGRDEIRLASVAEMLRLALIQAGAP